MSNINQPNDLKILLIEDDPVSNYIAFSRLKKIGIEDVVAVENGLEALNFLNNKTPDIIFLDINMPIMDGFEFLEVKKVRQLSMDSVIVMLTSSIRTQDKSRAMEFIDVIDFLEKPLDVRKIEQLLLKIGDKIKY